MARRQSNGNGKVVSSDTLVTDNSILSGTAKCHTYAYARYACGLGVKGDSLAMEAGSAIHVGMERWMKGEGTRRAIMGMSSYYEPVVDNYLRSIEEDNLPENELRLAPDRVAAIFAQHLSRLEERFPFKIIQAGVEKPVHAEMPNVEGVGGRKVLYVARLDAIVRKWEEGGKWSFDHKTTRSITDWWKDKQKVSSQWSGQVWIGQQHGVEKLEGVIVHAIELPKPYTKTSNCKEHGVPYTECSVRHAGYDFIYITRGPAEMEAWELSARRLIAEYAGLKDKADREGIAGVHEVPMQGRFNEGCVFCGMKEWCRVGRPTGARQLKVYFREDPWDPLAGKDEVLL